MELVQRLFNLYILPIFTSPRPFNKYGSTNTPTMPQHGVEVFPHNLVDSRVFLLKQVIARAAPIRVHGAVHTLQL
eukprot:66629-Lingulodinium_polyedra.AAC.1